MARPEHLTPIDETNVVVPYAEARAVEVHHAPLRRVADWVGQIPIPSISQYVGRHYLVGELVSRAVVFTYDGVHYSLPRWLSVLGGDTYEFPFACTVKAYNPPAL